MHIIKAISHVFKQVQFCLCWHKRLYFFLCAMQCCNIVLSFLYCICINKTRQMKLSASSVRQDRSLHSGILDNVSLGLRTPLPPAKNAQLSLFPMLRCHLGFSSISAPPSINQRCQIFLVAVSLSQWSRAFKYDSLPVKFVHAISAPPSTSPSPPGALSLFFNALFNSFFLGCWADALLSIIPHEV